LNLKPLSNDVKDGYVKQKQAESRNRHRLDVEVVIDEKQAEKEIERAMNRIIARLNKR
jgi:hypothetical protein